MELHYPNWVMAIALTMIAAGILPMPLVFLLRRFQILKVDLDIHQGSIRRNETTASTKEMIDQDDDVSNSFCTTEEKLKAIRNDISICFFLTHNFMASTSTLCHSLALFFLSFNFSLLFLICLIFIEKL